MEEKKIKEQMEIVEREITLSLLNDKLNYIISKINEQEEVK